MSYGSSVSDSVTKEDLIEQNEELQRIVRRLNEENEKLIEEARESLNEDLKAQATEVERQVESAKNSLILVEDRSESIKEDLSRIESATFFAALAGIWIAAMAAGAVLWIERAGVHPGWVLLVGLLVGMVNLGLLVLKAAVDWQ